MLARWAGMELQRGPAGSTAGRCRIDVYPEFVKLELPPTAPKQEQADSLCEAARLCQESACRGVVCIFSGSSPDFYLAAPAALDRMCELWSGTQRRLALVYADTAAKTACEYGCWAAARREIESQLFDEKQRAVDWLVGPGDVPGNRE